MRKKEETRFLYHAHAIGAAGSFTTPTADFLEAKPSVSLPVTGGRASARVENFRFQDILSYRLAETHAVGLFDPQSGAFSTLVTVAVEGLNVLNVITADRVVARLSSRHFLDPEREPSILTLGSHFEGLKIGGHPIEFDLDHQVMSEWDVYSKAAAGCQARRSGSVFHRNRIHTSVVTNVRAPAGCEVDHHRIHFPDLGTIHLGEFHITSDERRLTMLRIQFGCAVGGEASCGEVAGNGNSAPPAA